MIRKIKSSLPDGTFAVGVGLIVAGLSSYVYLAAVGRSLGEEHAASVLACWFLVYTFGPGCFLPLEQEIGRALAARRATSDTAWPVVGQAARLGAVGAAVLLVVGLVATPGLLHLLDGSVMLEIATLLGLVGYAVEHVARGTLAGLGRFTAYATVIAVEALFKVAFVVVVLLLGVRDVGWIGLPIGIAPFVAVWWATRDRPVRRTAEPLAPVAEVSTSLALLLAGSLLSLIQLNLGPLAASAFAGDAQRADAGRFSQIFVVSRIPVFFFQALQASLLPKLANLAGEGRHRDFRSGVGRVVGVVAAVAVAAVIGAALLGPFAVKVMFGSDSVVSRLDIALLAAAAGGYMLAVTLAQALVALGALGRAAIGWLPGLVAFFVVAIPIEGLHARVAWGLVADVFACAVAFAVLLWTRLGNADVPQTVDPLVDAIEHEFLEP